MASQVEPGQAVLATRWNAWIEISDAATRRLTTDRSVRVFHGRPIRGSAGLQIFRVGAVRPAQAGDGS
jgi:hypothetical protein